MIGVCATKVPKPNSCDNTEEDCEEIFEVRGHKRNRNSATLLDSRNKVLTDKSGDLNQSKENYNRNAGNKVPAKEVSSHKRSISQSKIYENTIYQ